MCGWFIASFLQSGEFLAVGVAIVTEVKVALEGFDKITVRAYPVQDMGPVRFFLNKCNFRSM